MSHGAQQQEVDSGVQGPPRRSRISRGDDIVLTIPPPGLSRGEIVHVVLLGLVAVLVLSVLVGTQWLGNGSVALVALVAALFLAGVAAYKIVRGLVDSTVVRLSDDAIRVTHRFPFHRSGVIHRADFRAIAIGRCSFVGKGYSCQRWEGEVKELVAIGRGQMLHFGAGLDDAEQVWMRDLVEEALMLDDSERPERGERREGELIQPPERLRLDMARYGAYSAVAALLLLAFLQLMGSAYSIKGAAFVVAAVSATVAILGYRAYRLEYVASGWHRAVVRTLAAIMDHRFSATDAAGKAQRLPDFPFFGGPRQFYNVTWDEEDPNGLVTFDFTTRRLTGLRNGVGCALPIEGLGRETISIRPRAHYGRMMMQPGMRVAGPQEFTQVYLVTAENEGRAQALLGPEVVAAISAWHGQGPQPWVCICASVVGVAIHRLHAGNDRMMREFYGYARTVRRAIVDQVGRLRSGSSEAPAAGQD
jgi:hypothetical protein